VSVAQTADLVEKHRAAMRFGQIADMIVECSRKSAARMPEEGVFEHAIGNGANVYSHTLA
jgi:hypothetical protein